MIQGNIRFFRGTKQMQHISHQEYSDSELEWSNLVLQFCLILPKTCVKGCLTVKFPAKNTGAYDTHAPIFYTYSVSNISSDEVNFPAKKNTVLKIRMRRFFKKIVFLISSTLSIKLIFSPLLSLSQLNVVSKCSKIFYFLSINHKYLTDQIILLLLVLSNCKLIR